MPLPIIKMAVILQTVGEDFMVWLHLSRLLLNYTIN